MTLNFCLNQVSLTAPHCRVSVQSTVSFTEVSMNIEHFIQYFFLQICSCLSRYLDFWESTIFSRQISSLEGTPFSKSSVIYCKKIKGTYFFCQNLIFVDFNWLVNPSFFFTRNTYNLILYVGAIYEFIMIMYYILSSIQAYYVNASDRPYTFKLTVNTKGKHSY